MTDVIVVNRLFAVEHNVLIENLLIDIDHMTDSQFRMKYHISMDVEIEFSDDLDDDCEGFAEEQVGYNMGVFEMPMVENDDGSSSWDGFHMDYNEQ